MALAAFACQIFGGPAAVLASEFKAGCYAVDISPHVLPAIQNGGFLEKTSDRVDDPLHARCLVLSNGDTTVALAIVDSCMLPRDVCDAIKQLAVQATGIPASCILIAATHTHSAPSVMDYCLGSRRDNTYTAFVIPRIAAAIARAHGLAVPAKAGWAVVDAPRHTACRRWIHRPGVTSNDPFGEPTVRAMMHPGYRNPEYLAPAGPIDTALTLLSIQTVDGRPLTVLANYSMHYFGGTSGFSADYFGDFARYLEERLSGGDNGSGPQFMAAMSQGTSGDLHWMNYLEPPRRDYPRSQYAQEMGEMAIKAIDGIEYRSDVDLAMAETRLPLSRRQPSPARIAWAQAIDTNRGERRPKDQPEVYAEQALWLRDNPTTELVLQAVRIGDLGMTAIPNEVFGITGLKLKAQSPLQPLMNVELANGAEGYIPPPEQHYLGGYTTWPARTAGLETEAEPQIVDALLGLLEQVAGGAQRRALHDNFYTAEQTSAIEQARRDDNNRENRGAAGAEH